MKHRVGDMLDYRAHHPEALYFITTNSFLRADGSLVMGRGIAKSVRDSEPGFDALAGQAVAQKCGHLGVYGVLRPDRARSLFLFQVKRNFRDKADVQLIAKSTSMLRALAQRWGHLEFHLNFPGIGNGKLKPQHVLPIVRTLPNNVFLWELG